MIFSLSEKVKAHSLPEFPETDIFCFYHSASAVKVPVEVMWTAVLSSLKLKKNVLILETNLAQIPSLGTQRWLVGEEFLWLAPRASSVLLEATLKKTSSYPSIKAYLTTFN